MGIGTGAVAVLAVSIGIGVAAAATNGTSPGTIVCPTVADKLPAIPAQAQAEVNTNLALLNTQINEANNRLATTAGQGGPNFVNNAILGPLKDKRFATINRIATAIGRNATRPTGLAESLSTCRLDTAGGTPQAEPTTVSAAPAVPGAPANGSSPGTIVCPSVADKLPAIPAQAQAEVNTNLALLNTQINEANNRLATTAGQGGPNFVNNAILGPLKDKRFATINRIATAIGRNATRPTGLAESLSTCTLTAR